MKTVAPTATSLVELFKRRGIPDRHISFWASESDKPAQEFGLDLLAGERAAVSMSASVTCGPCWLTTERFVWTNAGTRLQISLDQVADVSPLVLSNREEPPALAMQVEDFDKKVHDIRMPDVGVLNGFMAVLHRYTRRAR